MLRNWRAWLLLVLLVGPFVAYIGFGALWLAERHWLLPATVLWITSGIVFAVLAARWTRSRQPLLPPIDWDLPRTFTPFDRQAWDLVQEEANQGEAVSLDELSTFDLYIDTGRRLARRLAAHYHPLSNDPIEHVPIVELLTALELAAEDLNRLCRQVPGGDLVTPAHWKRAIQAAEYFNWANDVYTYLLPVLQPVTGLVRWGTQRWMVKPAWRNMQQNLLRWFYQAFLNRLGTHLIELYSGRLAIGADQYRRLTRRTIDGHLGPEVQAAHLVVAVAGARDSGKSRLISSLTKVSTGEPSIVRARLSAAGFDDSLADLLGQVEWIEVPGFTVNASHESARDRATRRESVEAAARADLLLLVVDGSRDNHSAETQFAQAWDRWFLEHPGFEVPPALAVLTGADRSGWAGEWRPPHDWASGRSSREAAVRKQLEALRAALPPTITEIIAVGLHEETPYGVREQLLPAVASLLHRAERVALIRQLHHAATRSKARRLFSQVGQQGKKLWQHLKAPRQAGEKAR